ncbi:MAG: porphobilinogen synthase, partial [Verrucomicrobia bacterium]|nr:porphobilinogen synthase [Verrucomicrobiota bacterium]
MSESFKLELQRRPRRLRQSVALRELARETRLEAARLIQPLFVIEGQGKAEAIASMPGMYRLTIPLLVEECRSLQALGIS